MSDTYKQKIQQQYQKLICYFKEFNNICWSHKELFYMWWGIWIRESEFELGGGGEKGCWNFEQINLTVFLYFQFRNKFITSGIYFF